jgi:pimeloyl-ACP methyl ester carboxylesterase
MRLKHGHIWLELHELQAGDGLPLLLLHALAGSSADWKTPPRWPGPVYALDFCGHGASDWLAGGSYYPEMLAADADTALAHLGRAAVAGAGLGAYIALMLAGARPAQVPAVLLLPGAGLEGAGSVPEFEAPFPNVSDIAKRPTGQSDPFIALLEYFVRPEVYAEALAEAANRIVLIDNGDATPPWWQAVRGRGNARVMADEREAFEHLARAAS